MIRHDTVIRGGTIVDGSGMQSFVGDVAISNGVITAIGTVDGQGAEEIDAAGLLVTPGFVDVHTHYDGQAIWSDRLNPSSGHGVTTVIVGNCGVGFAPCRKDDHDLLIRVMEGVEDIPGVVMSEGLDWAWESFPQFLDALEKRPRDIDMAAYLPHSPLRVYVMGERGANREDATPDDLAKMRALAKEAIEAGAIGFATSRITLHKSIDGTPIPSFEAPMNELREIAFGMADGGGGLFQVVPDVMREGTYRAAMEPLVRVAIETKQPITFTYGTSGLEPAGEPSMKDLMAEAKAAGVAVIGQVFPRPVGLIMGLDLSIHPFCLRPSYKEIAELPLADRVAAMRDPARRARILSETNDEGHPLAQFGMRPQLTFEMEPIPNYEPDPKDSIQAKANAKGCTAEELYYELMLQEGGHKMFLVALTNAEGGRLDRVAEILQEENVVVGLGDGGAHYGMICDSSYPTTLLAHWGRDRNGSKLPVERIVKIMTSETAEIAGLFDRGRLAPGYKADINIIDFDAIRLYAPKVVHDLPAGGRRLDQQADGYKLTMVSGEVIARDGKPAAARPGKLIRGRQPAPVAASHA